MFVRLSAGALRMTRKTILFFQRAHNIFILANAPIAHRHRHPQIARQSLADAESAGSSLSLYVNPVGVIVVVISRLCVFKCIMCTQPVRAVKTRGSGCALYCVRGINIGDPTQSKSLSTFTKFYPSSFLPALCTPHIAPKLVAYITSSLVAWL